MIVVSASLPKCGSGWLFNLTNDLLVRAGHTDARALRGAYGLEDVLQRHNCRINPRPRNLLRLLRPHWRGETFAVKTHSGPTPGLRVLLGLGVAKATCIQRDPRDAALSALDHARRARVAGQQRLMARIVDLEDAVAYVERSLPAWEAWARDPRTLLVRYEDLVADTAKQLARLADFLLLAVSSQDLADVAAAYAVAEGARPPGEGLHFNKGIAGRFRSELTPSEQDLCSRRFGPYLERMGYAV